jgi:hypothetical protein
VSHAVLIPRVFFGLSLCIVKLLKFIRRTLSEVTANKSMRKFPFTVAYALVTRLLLKGEESVHLKGLRLA